MDTDPGTGADIDTGDPGDSPWDILTDVDPDPPIEGDYVVPEYDTPLLVGLVNQDEDLVGRARFAGENRLGEEVNRRRGILGLVDKIWKGGIARSYYRQKYINEARRDMLTAESVLLDYDEKERRRYNRDVCSVFLDSAEGIIDEVSGDARMSLLAEHPELHARIRDIVERYADGTIPDTEAAKREFTEAIGSLSDEDGSYGAGHLSATNITDIAIEAKRRYENMMTVAETVGGEMEHRDAMDRVMAGFDVIYGQRQADRLTPHYNNVDKIIDKMQSSGIGCVVQPEVLGLAVGAGMSVAEFLGKRVTSTVLSAVPGLGGVVIGGLSAGTTFEQERARAAFDVRYNRDFEASEKRRREVMGTLHEHHAASEVADDLEGQVTTIRNMLDEGHDISAARTELLNAVARCKRYLELDKTADSVLTFSSETEAPREQLKLLQRYSRAKEFLRNNGVGDLDDQLDARSNLMQNIMNDIEQNISSANKAARKAKISRIAKRAGFSLVSGLVIQEVMALVNPNVQGLFEKTSDDYTGRLTAGKKLASLFGKPALKTTPVSPDNATVNFNLSSSELSGNESEALNFARATDGTYSLMHHGEEVATGIDWNSETGEMTEASLNALRAQGIEVTEAEGIKQQIVEHITGTRTRQVSVKEFYDSVGDQITKIKRLFWYDNDTPRPDFNELRCYNYADPATGQGGLLADFLEGGSKHAGAVANFAQLVQDGKIKMLISPTGDTQMRPIEVLGKMLPDGKIAFVPEEGSVASVFFDASGNFNGRFAEIVQDLGVDADGNQLVASFATEVGRGYDGLMTLTEPVEDTITRDIDVPRYILSAANEAIVEVREKLAAAFPVIFPFTPQGAMKASRRRTTATPEAEPGPRANYGGYGGYDPGLSEDRLGEVSPRIAEGKTLELGREVAWYREQMRAKRGEDYLRRIDEKVSRSPELSHLDQNIKTIVTIPVHAPTEYNNIYKTLSLYARQEDVDMGSVMVFLDMNWRERENGTPEEVRQNIQRTYDEIDRARRDFPQLQVATMEQQGHHGIHEVAREMNDVLLTAINSAIENGRMRSDNDILIIRNDADLRHLNSKYIASYQKSMQENPKTPMFTGTTWFNIDRQNVAPGFGAVLTVERMNNLLRALDGGIHTAGGNFAYRATHFAAINGYGFEADGAFGAWTGAGSDDLRVGYRLEEAFINAYANRADSSTAPGNDDLMDPSTRMLVRVGGATIDTDDARYLKFYAAPNDLVTNDAYRNVAGGYGQNVLRPADMAGFTEDLTDRQRFNEVVAQFEREMSDFYTLDGGSSPSLDRILRWWFSMPTDTLYTVEDTGNVSEGREVYQFRFTDEGKRRYRQSLLARMGDGLNPDVRNSLQRAVDDGDWLTPITA